VKEGRVEPSKGREKRRGSSWEEGDTTFTSDTMVRMGGGHLLCLIMKPHFFFSAALSLSLKNQPVCIVIIFQFLYLHIHFFRLLSSLLY
jgi:hypothetical protein